MDEKKLFNYSVIEDLETIFLRKIEEVLKSKNVANIAQYTKAGELIESLKEKLVVANHQYLEITQYLNLNENIFSFDIKVTPGMVSQSYLTLKPFDAPQINESLLPSEGIDFKVVFPKPIEEIATSYIKKTNRLKDRGNIKKFFEEFEVIPGTILTFTQLKRNCEYSIEIKQK